MTFPSDIKLAMRECILKLLWPKDDIVAFFESNSCTKADIKALGDHKTMHRYAIVDAMFDHLGTQPDEGLGQFRARTDRFRQGQCLRWRARCVRMFAWH